MHEKSELPAFKQTCSHLHCFMTGVWVLGRLFYLLSSKPFKDTISAFSSPTVWLSRMRLVEDDAYRKATSETHAQQLSHTHTPALFRSHAGSQHKVNICLSTTLLCSTPQYKIIKTALLRKKDIGYKVNKYGKCKC